MYTNRNANGKPSKKTEQSLQAGGKEAYFMEILYGREYLGLDENLCVQNV